MSSRKSKVRRVSTSPSSSSFDGNDEVLLADTTTSDSDNDQHQKGPTLSQESRDRRMQLINEAIESVLALSSNPLKAPTKLTDDNFGQDQLIILTSQAKEEGTTGIEVENAVTSNETEAKVVTAQDLNDARFRKLLRQKKSNCTKAEALASDFVCNGIHHPVISCFREVMNNNDFAAILSPKHRKHLGSFEFSLVCVGLVDCLAMTLHNPLYQESYDSKWNSKIASKVEKVLHELKSILTIWGTSEKTTEKDRYGVIMNYFRRLVPYFKPIKFDQSYELILSAIGYDVERISLAKEAQSKAMKSFYNNDIISSKGNNITKVTNAEPCSSTSQASSFFASIERTVSSLVGTKRHSSALSISSQNEENKEDFKTLSSGSATSPQKKPKIALSSTTDNSVYNRKTDVEQRTITLEDADDEQPASKKPRIGPKLPNITCTKILKEELSGVTKLEKPKVNAFALMMNRSRQLAEQNKLRKTISTEKVKGVTR